jgi:hypothetical protein
VLDDDTGRTIPEQIKTFTHSHAASASAMLL